LDAARIRNRFVQRHAMNDEPTINRLLARVAGTGPPVRNDVHPLAGLGEQAGDVTNISADAARRICRRRVFAADEEMRQGLNLRTVSMKTGLL
jgi:hypothetical protein